MQEAGALFRFCLLFLFAASCRLHLPSVLPRDPIGPLSACELLYANFPEADVKTQSIYVKFCKDARAAMGS